MFSWTGIDGFVLKGCSPLFFFFLASFPHIPLSVSPLTTFEPLDGFSWNLVRTSWHWKPIHFCNSQISVPRWRPCKLLKWKRHLPHGPQISLRIDSLQAEISTRDHTWVNFCVDWVLRMLSFDQKSLKYQETICWCAPCYNNSVVVTQTYRLTADQVLTLWRSYK